MAKHFHEKPNMYVSHIQLKVSNLARSLEFYEKVIGFKVLERSGERVYLTTDGKSSPVSLVQIEDAVHLRRGQTGLYHLALLLPTRRDLGNLLQHLIDMDVRFGEGTTTSVRRYTWRIRMVMALSYTLTGVKIAGSGKMMQFI